MPSKVIAGHTFDINLDPSNLNYEKRSELSNTYVGYTVDEYTKLFIYYLNVIGCFALLFLSIAVNKMFIFFLAFLCLMLLKTKWYYLMAWSKKFKWKKKRMVRIDD